MSSPHLIPRLYIGSDLDQGRAVTIDSGQSHYLQHVMRLKAGDVVRLFNGRDGEWLAGASIPSKRKLELVIQKKLRAQMPEPDLWLCCAPIKRAHFEYMIEKATELGVSTIRPILTMRTEVRDVNSERCSKIAIEAAEQSERLSIPAIQKPLGLKKLIAEWPSDRVPLVCAEWGDAIHVHGAFMDPRLKHAKAGIFTGPEGGFVAEEFAALKQIKDAIFIRLGPRILRADTAAIAALSCWQAMQGDWTEN